MLPAAPWALGHTQPRMSPHRPTLDQPVPHPGKAGKGPLPKLPGRVLSRAAADRRNPPRSTMRESSRHSHRARMNSTTAQLRRADTPAAGSANPGWCRPCAQVQSRFCACFQIGVWACADRRPRQTAAASRNEGYAKRPILGLPAKIFPHWKRSKALK